jgi:hypothetical protein
VPASEKSYIISEATRQKVINAQWMYGSKGRHGLDVLAPWPDKVPNRIRSGFLGKKKWLDNDHSLSFTDFLAEAKREMREEKKSLTSTKSYAT